MRKQLIASFDAALKKVGLTEHREALLADARECVRMHYGKPVKRLPRGASRVGGTPELPASASWPDGLHEDKPHGKAEFIAQFNLSELPDVEGLGLPREGYLWVFVCDVSCYSAAVIYSDESEPIATRPKPSHKATPHTLDWNLSMAPLTFSVGVSLPYSSKIFRRKCEAMSISGHTQYELMKALGGDDSYGARPRDGFDGQIGGYSYQAEYDLCREIAMTQLGGGDAIHADGYDSIAELDMAIGRGLPPPLTESFMKVDTYRAHLVEKRPQVAWIEKNQDSITALAASIKLLCMFRESHSIGLEFGDGMYLDFFIDEQSLAQRDFSLVHCRLPMLL